MIRSRFSALAIAFLLTPLAAGAAPAAAKPHQSNGHHLKGDYSFRLTPAVSFAPWFDGTNGKDSGVVLAPRQDILRVGTLSFGGGGEEKHHGGGGGGSSSGDVTGHTIATTDDGLTTVVIDFTWSGTFSINDDGTGTLTIATVNVTDASCTPAQNPGDCATFESPETFAFVLNRHGEDKTLDLIETDNEGGGAKIFLTGEAKRR